MAFEAGTIVGRLALDSSKFRKSLEVSGKETKKFGNIVERNGEKIKALSRGMLIAGAAIVGALAMMTKKASDFEEASAKFGTVFQEVTKEANAAIEDLSKNYGLSKLAATEMLSATGDLLIGLGLQSSEALTLSQRTQKLAIDLASFTNFQGGAKGAADALTKAMTGERESVKALGIVITEEMVKEQLLKEGKEKLTGMSLLQAKAEATLAIATIQSKNAMGDYERTQGSLANVVRRLAGRLENLWVIIGTKLIPATTKYAGKITEIVEKTVAWTEAQPKLTSALTLGTAALGGTLLTLGGIGMILPKIAGGFHIVKVAAIGLGPIFWSIAAGAAAAYGAVKLLEKLRPGAVLDEQTKAYKKITEVIGFWSDFEDAAVRAGVARREDLIAIWDKYEQNTQATLSAIATGTEGEALQEFLRKLTRGHSDALAAAVEQGEGLEEAIEEPAKAIKKTTPVYDSWATTVGKIFHDTSVRAADMRGAIETKIKLPPIAVNIPKMSLEDFKKWYKQWLEDLKQSWKDAWEAMIRWAGFFVSGLGNVLSQLSANQMQLIDNEEQRRTEAFNSRTAKETEALESWYEREKEKIEATIINEEEKDEALAALAEAYAKKENALAITQAITQAKLEEDIEKKRKEAIRTAAKRTKAVGILQAIVHTASAIIEALPNIPLSIAVGIMGAAQMATIAAAPLPALAEGAIFERPTYLVGEGRETEVLSPLSKLPELFEKTVGRQGGGAKVDFNFYAPIISTTGIANSDLDRVSEELFSRMEREARRRGYSLNG